MDVLKYMGLHMYAWIPRTILKKDLCAYMWHSSLQFLLHFFLSRVKVKQYFVNSVH